MASRISCVHNHSRIVAYSIICSAPPSDPDGAVNLFGALRRAMAKTGYSDLKEFQKVGLTVRG